MDLESADHMTCAFNNLEFPKSYASSSHVKLSVGSSTIVIYVDSITISEEHMLHNVRYVPDFQFNLLSISKFNSEITMVLFSMFRFASFRTYRLWK